MAVLCVISSVVDGCVVCDEWCGGWGVLCVIRSLVDAVCCV